MDGSRRRRGSLRGRTRVAAAAATALAAAVTSAFVLLSAPAPARALPQLKPLLVGIGDQSPMTFRQPLYRKLGLQISRLVVPWNAALDPSRREWVSNWLAAAHHAGVTPLVAFGRFSGQSMKPPSVGAYRRAFIAFHHDFPQVRQYTPWNEANHQSQPTFRRPGRAAAYYEVMRNRCRGCIVLGADVLDTHSAGRWLTQFMRALRGPRPTVWGLHNYIDVNRHHPVARGGTARVLNTVPGDVWLTETGGLVKTAVLPYNEQRAARATRYLFTIAGAWRSRISRVYLYNWRGVVNKRTARKQPKAWDSGMMEPNGKPRPEYWALRGELSRLRLGCWSGVRKTKNTPWLSGCARSGKRRG